MSYIGNTSVTQAFTPAVDYFSGTGSATAFTLSRPVASVAQVQVVVNNVAQNPSSAYTVSSNTITFTSAPSAGTNNIYVYYTSPITQVIAPGQGTVTTTSLSSSLQIPLATNVSGILPVANGGTGVTTSTGSGANVLGTSPTLTSPTISGTPVMGASVLTSGTAVASTSGTSIDFTSIPSWVKRITVMFVGVSTSGTSSPLIQLGTGGSPTTSGYLGANWWTTHTGSNQIGNFSSGFGLNLLNGAAAAIYHGSIVCTLQTGNTWTCSFVLGQSNATSASNGAGSIALAGVLNLVRITTVNGTDTFDAGSINILYE